ncbi:helicase associated domain-containing protein [Pseudarthrobacter sp. P1]|uniref:helicase associated domain-containing protein n=1 Tax=Pseudarthrobacter sp. P1 TaxID=3418418 RepID=UPI003CE87422
MWLIDQRAGLAKGSLTREKIAALDAVGNWRLSARSAADARRWQQRLAELAAFIHASGRWPRWRGYTSEHERILGVWLHAQRQQHRRSKLGSAQVASLDASAPHWADNHRYTP